MPEYTYKCTKCNHQFDIYHGIKEPVKKKCPECKKNTLERLISAVNGFVKGIKTLGQLAEKNTKKMGSKLDTPEARAKAEAKAKQKEYREINKMTKEQKERYIRYGK